MEESELEDLFNECNAHTYIDRLNEGYSKLLIRINRVFASGDKLMAQNLLLALESDRPKSYIRKRQEPKPLPLIVPKQKVEVDKIVKKKRVMDLPFLKGTYTQKEIETNLGKSYLTVFKTRLKKCVYIPDLIEVVNKTVITKPILLLAIQWIGDYTLNNLISQSKIDGLLEYLDDAHFDAPSKYLEEAVRTLPKKSEDQIVIPISSEKQTELLWANNAKAVYKKTPNVYTNEQAERLGLENTSIIIHNKVNKEYSKEIKYEGFLLQDKLPVNISVTEIRDEWSILEFFRQLGNVAAALTVLKTSRKTYNLILKERGLL